MHVELAEYYKNGQMVANIKAVMGQEAILVELVVA